ncbi:hypothetical protein [Paraburkholderia kururiensis]|uniref:Uncharacterized protein n=1 Tax=Paraburkholderia kururiensis TaxID=984307 RepID=A0ABZ0WDX1_9BURK|nr:hypothetical protein U0042_15295 [Paraburkholderia kururiensis]
MDQLLKTRKRSARLRLPGGIGQIGRRKVRRESGKFPADSLRHALRRERRAENRCVSGFSAVSPFYQGQIMASTAK